MKEFFPNLKQYLLDGHKVYINFEQLTPSKNVTAYSVNFQNNELYGSSARNLLSAFCVAENKLSQKEHNSNDYNKILTFSKKIINLENNLLKINNISNAFHYLYKGMLKVQNNKDDYSIFVKDNKMYFTKLVNNKPAIIIGQTLAENSLIDLLNATCNHLELKTNKNLSVFDKNFDFIK